MTLRYQNEGNPAVLARVPYSGKWVLDIGCGAGDNARILKERGHSVVGITFDGEEARIAGAFCDVIVHDLTRGLPSSARSFDCVVCSHILEHLADPSPVLRDIARILSPGGTLIVALPNTLHYRPRLAFLFGRFEYRDTGILDRTHLRFYTFRSGREMLERHGFAVQEAIGDGWFPWGPLRHVVPKGVQNSVNRLVCRAVPGLFGNQLVYVCSPNIKGLT